MSESHVYTNWKLSIVPNKLPFMGHHDVIPLVIVTRAVHGSSKIKDIGIVSCISVLLAKSIDVVQLLLDLRASLNHICFVIVIKKTGMLFVQCDDYIRLEFVDAILASPVVVYQLNHIVHGKDYLEFLNIRDVATEEVQFVRRFDRLAKTNDICSKMSLPFGNCVSKTDVIGRSSFWKRRVDEKVCIILRKFCDDISSSHVMLNQFRPHTLPGECTDFAHEKLLSFGTFHRASKHRVKK
mmetsp:Transcript_22479/g.34712  ORF Transcript_22479/g.34712 Transcript_22479/m.34712 type:complete len:239 (+) Transcript_22479:404-1120(+)